MEKHEAGEPASAEAYDRQGDTPLSPELEEHIERVVEQKLTEASSKPEALWTVTDVANFLRVSKRTVETLIAEEAIRPLRIRGSRRFTPAAIRSYLRAAANAVG